MKHRSHQPGGNVPLFEPPPVRKSAYTPKDNRLKDEPVFRIKTESLQPNPHGIRPFKIDTEENNLVASIREHGILQPLLVCSDGKDRYIILEGHRRWEAARELDLPEVPALVRTANHNDMLTVALVANFQREELHPVDTVRLFAKLYEIHKDQKTVARLTGVGDSYARNILACRYIPDKDLEKLRTPEMTISMIRKEQTANYPAFEKADVASATLPGIMDTPKPVVSDRHIHPSQLKDRMAAAGASLSNAALNTAETAVEPREPQTYRITQEQIEAVERARQGETQPDPAEARDNILPMPEKPDAPKWVTLEYTYRDDARKPVWAGTLRFQDAGDQNDETALAILEQWAGLYREQIGKRSKAARAPGSKAS